MKLAPIALLSELKNTTSNEKHLQFSDYAHAVCLTYKLTTSSINSIDLSIGLNESFETRKQQLSNGKKATSKGGFLVRNYSKVVFGYADYRENGTFCLGFILTLRSKIDVVTPGAGVGVAQLRC